ncbi:MULTISPECIES: hypothetical protein [unclassified Streptomyces]|uniref:hypothetical protein n=1 Tax=Streptomyces sp. NPDC055082 TaxID=3365718 RepID=UPI0037CD4363
MPAPATPATLATLARGLEDLIADFPTDPAVITVSALTDDIGMLTHHLQHLAEHAQERFTAQRVHVPEHRVLVQLAEAAAEIAGALNVLTHALAQTVDSLCEEAPAYLPASRPANGTQAARLVAAEKYAEARFRLRDTVLRLRPAPDAGCPPRAATPRATASIPASARAAVNRR